MRWIWCLFLIGCVGVVQGAVLAGWDVEGMDVASGVGILTNVPPYAFSATTSEVSCVDAFLLLGDGVNPSTSADVYGFKISTEDQTNSLKGAIAAHHYIEFSLSVDDGYLLNLHSIEMVGEGTAGSCSNVVLMSSVGGFELGQEMASATAANQRGGFDTDSSGFGGPIDLSAEQFQNLGGCVTFRLYGWGSSSGNSTTRIRNLTGDDLVVYGEVVPAVSSGFPCLIVSPSCNGTCVSADFDPGEIGGYMLQRTSDLSASNGWENVSGPFYGTTNVMIDTSGSVGFYRLKKEEG